MKHMQPRHPDGGQRTGVGVIGCGGHACGNNIPGAAANPNLELVAFCDLRADVLDRLKRQYTPKFVTTDMEDVFKDPAVGLVVCATKPDVRIPVMKLAVKYRKPLFVEKPMAYSREDLMEACRIMGRAPVPFIVGFNRPYSPMMQAIKPLFEKHRTGQTTIAYRIVGESAIWPPEHRHNVLVKGESTVVHETTHIFDLLNWLTDRRPHRVYMAGGGNVDNVVTLEYPDDITAVIVAGDNGSVGYPKERVEINTGCATVVGDFFVEMTVAGMGGQFGRRVFPYRYQGRTFEDGFEGVKRKWLDWRAGLSEEKRAVGHFFGQTPEIDKGHNAQLESFRRMALAGAPRPDLVARGALPNVIAEAALESWRQKRPQVIDYAELDAALGAPPPASIVPTP